PATHTSTLSLHDARAIFARHHLHPLGDEGAERLSVLLVQGSEDHRRVENLLEPFACGPALAPQQDGDPSDAGDPLQRHGQPDLADRKSTRLNSSHVKISY